MCIRDRIFVCDDSPVIILENAIVSNEVSFAWSTTGSGTFEGDPLNRTYIPSVSDLSRDSVADPIILTLSAVGKDGCSEASDEIRFTINKTPTVDIPFDNYEHCALEDIDLSLLSSEIKAFNYSQVEWSHDGEGDFVNSNILKPIYKPCFQIISSISSMCRVRLISTFLLKRICLNYFLN